MEFSPDGFARAMHAIENDDEDFELEEDPGTLSEDDAMETELSANGISAQEHVSAALSIIPPLAGGGTIAERMHAALWPYVVVAAMATGAPAAEALPGLGSPASTTAVAVAAAPRLLGEQLEGDAVIEGLVAGDAR